MEKSSIKRVLLTGHLGFIGQNMFRHLCWRGIEVLGLEKHQKYEQSFLENIDAVIHLGAVSSTTETDWYKLRQNNIILSKRIILDCVDRNIPVQYASSASVYGDLRDTNESYPYLIPKNKYALSKWRLDQWVMERKFPNVQGFRYFNVYGNFEHHKSDQASPVSKFTWQALRDGKIKVFENSHKYLRDFVSVSDVCNAHISFLFKDNVSGIFNIGTGKPVSFLDVASCIARKYNAKITEIPMPENLKAGYQKFTKANLNKFHNILPDFNFVSVENWIKYNSINLNPV